MSGDAKPSPDVNVNEVLDPAKALVPATLRVNEEKVREGFLPKIRKVAAKIPFAADALSVWWAARDPETPVAAKGMMLAGLAYFVLPTDALPDLLPVIGFTDDAAVIAALVAILGKTLKPRHKEAAQAFLSRLSDDA
ncbi:YkvA family protein [Caulobacter sp. SL161]|uniref:YkvA family protein n=1 Tax=Caulobacter sp. SL161 TaxID=2995156 RepID=UPI0022752130|nr:YkvA family protein [Caulobacter sp. SL161]MCY1646176.1 YkvA family protein [Caulobacter sp. SL161]